MKDYCVLNSENMFITFVEAEQKDGILTAKNYTLKSGEYLLDALPPTAKIHAADPNPLRSRWNGAEWEEAADSAEIATWELEHPAPTAPSTPTLDQRTAALEAAMLTMMGGDGNV